MSDAMAPEPKQEPKEEPKHIAIADDLEATGAHLEHGSEKPERSKLQRGLSEQEAFALAANSQEVDDELAELEEELRRNPRKLRWYDYEITFSNPKYFTYILVAFASMGGLLSGLDQSLISGANLYMPGDLGLNDQQVSLINSAMPLGAVGGALLLSPANEYLGRKFAIIWACVLYTIGAALEAGAISYPMMILGRLILGLGLGLEGGTVPVYVAESVARKYRGNLVSLYQFNIALGEVLGYAVAAMFVSVEGNWRFMLGSSLVFSTIMLLGMIVMPESPRFLMHKGRMTDAYQVWKRIRGEDDEARQEFFIMRYAVLNESGADEAQKNRFAWMDFFTVGRCRRAIIYANIMIFLGQFTGINAIMYYMSVLMSQVGFTDEQSVFMSLVGGGALLLGTIPAIFYMERFGRRFWAIAMLPGFFIGLMIIGLGYLIPTSNTGAASGVYITGLVIYSGFFGCYSCLTWVIPSEVYPTYLRSYGMTTSDAMLFLCSFIVTYNFTAMENAMTKIGLTLGFYGGIAVVGWFYQILFMPETRNKTLEEIDTLFQQPTRELVKENWENCKQTTRDIVGLRWRKVFAPQEKSEVVVSH